MEATRADQHTPPGTEADAGHPRRWAVLAVVSLSMFVTVLDGTIVNIALPTLTTELGASTRQLQWIVDAYLLVFTGLLLAAGGLGDRDTTCAIVAGILAPAVDEVPEEWVQRAEPVPPF